MEKTKGVLLVTGSSGFIGSAISRHFAGRFQVVGLDRDPPKEKIPGVEHISMDISSNAGIAGALEQVRKKFGPEVQAVVHLAAYYSFSGKEDEKYESITVRGTEHFLERLREIFSLHQFIFSSTMLVHAPSEPGREISEHSRLEPGWPYPQSKVDAEEAIAAKRGKVPVVNLRIAGVYDDYCHSIPLAQHIARVFERQLSSIFFPGDVSHGQAFLHLEDLISAIDAAVTLRDSMPKHVTLLLGEDHPVSYRELQAKFGLLLHGRAWPTIRIPAFLARAGAFLLERMPFVRSPFIKPWMIKYADEHYDLNISRAKAQLQWEPRQFLSESIPKMIRALQNDPEKWYREHKIKKPLFRAIEPVSPARESVYLALAWANAFLGLWLISNPFTLGYSAALPFWNDLISGALITGLAFLSLAPTLRWLRWVNAAIAVWLIFSPLAFWTESAAIYASNTVIGSMVLLASAFTPSRLSPATSPADNPPGWSYNPSAWGQRLPIMTLAFLGFLLARYLSAFQLGHIPEAWDPFFGEGTETILTSRVSRAFPVSDAGLGAFSYLLDVLSAAIGDKRRWKTMPWMVILFGLMIIPTGVTSVVLVMLQPIAVGAWCTICLLTAAIMLAMVPPAVDEVVASVQFLAKSYRAGEPFWKTLFRGDSKEPLPPPPEVLRGPRAFPVSLAVAALLGIWLLFIPSLFGLTGQAANNLYIVAALIITFAVVAVAEIARVTRFVLTPLGAWLILSAWFTGPMPAAAAWHSVAAGLTLILLSIPKGSISNRFGELDEWVRWAPFRKREAGEKTETRKAA